MTKLIIVFNNLIPEQKISNEMTKKYFSNYPTLVGQDIFVEKLLPENTVIQDFIGLNKMPTIRNIHLQRSQASLCFISSSTDLDVLKEWLCNIKKAYNSREGNKPLAAVVIHNEGTDNISKKITNELQASKMTIFYSKDTNKKTLWNEFNKALTPKQMTKSYSLKNQQHFAFSDPTTKQASNEKVKENNNIELQDVILPQA